MGVPHGGKSFRLMSIDVHTIEADKLVRSYHIEDGWLGAARELFTRERHNDGGKQRSKKKPARLVWAGVGRTSTS